jgi:superfamily I DNA/RNA helicase
MTRLVLEQNWRPVGIRDLEQAAWETVKSSANMSVVAGPGSGKTELLAQRACFLLETGRCRNPRRILAISFKRDSAANLRSRVRERCSSELVARFDSLTFDAFSKSLLDRFRDALPEFRRPAEYIISEPKDFEINRFLNEMQYRYRESWKGNWGTRPGPKAFMSKYVLGLPIPIQPVEPRDFWEWVTDLWWRQSLQGKDKRSNLSFPMIGRLAELLLRVNPAISIALRATYSHVFMDEFQDTTGIQYSLVITAFQGTPVVLTAVGDKKQQIMRWAGALDDAFDRYETDFEAERRTSCESCTTWDTALDDLEGSDSIPMLTIHKSKGLEYDTVVFVGLDDQAWWSFPSEPEESKSAFFVAFSRAKQRVIFTYCKARGGQKKISSLYDLLSSSGVESVNIGDSGD